MKLVSLFSWFYTASLQHHVVALCFYTKNTTQLLYCYPALHLHIFPFFHSRNMNGCINHPHQYQKELLDVKTDTFHCGCDVSLRSLNTSFDIGSVIDIWATARQIQQNNMCAQQRLRSAWASTQSDQSFRYPCEEALGLWLPIKRTAIRLNHPCGLAVSARNFGSRGRGFEILPEHKQRFMTQSLSCSPFHCPEMTEILLKGM